MCEKCLAQILQRWYHSFPNPQYKGLDTTHNSKCLLTIEWKVSRYREKQNTYTHNLKFLIQSKVAALVFFFYLLYLNYFIFPFFLKSLISHIYPTDKSKIRHHSVISNKNQTFKHILCGVPIPLLSSSHILPQAPKETWENLRKLLCTTGVNLLKTGKLKAPPLSSSLLGKWEV